MNNQIRIIIMISLCTLSIGTYGQYNSMRKAVYESNVLSVSFIIIDRKYEREDSISIKVEYINKSDKNLYIYNPSFSKSRTDFVHSNPKSNECVLELGGSFLWDLGRPNALSLKKIKPHSHFNSYIKMKKPVSSYNGNNMLFKDSYDIDGQLQLLYFYVGYISDQKGINLIPNGEFYAISEANEYKEVELFEKYYCRKLIGPLYLVL